MQANSKEHPSIQLEQFFASGKLKPTNADSKETNETAPLEDQMSENVPVRASCEKAYRGHYNVEIQPQCSSTGFVSGSTVVEEKAGSSKRININMSDNKVGNINQNFNQPGTIIYNVNGPVQHEHVLKKREKINNVTLPINTFTGRESELEEIKRLFQTDKYKVVALVGMGGLGKSQLARAFVKANESAYNDKYWVDAETMEQLLSSFDRLAKKLKVEPNHDAETVCEIYRSFKDGPALIILDNVPDVNTVYTYLPTRIDLSDITLHFLVTSRWREWRNDHEIISLQLEPLGVEVCLHLFRKLLGDDIYKQEAAKTWMDVIAIFKQLPLALQLSALYIKNQFKFNIKFTINNYINQLQSKTTEMYNKLLTKTIPEYEENQPVFVAIVMTLKLLERRHSKLVVKVVNVSAYFNPERIFIEDLQSIVDENDDLVEILADIVNYSLFNQVDKNNGIYSMHRLIQTSIQIYQKENNTAQNYYLQALQSVLNNSKSEQSTVFQFANDFEDIILQTYRSYKHELLLFLVNNHCYDALTILFNNCKDNVISNIYSNDLIYLLTDRQDVGMLDFLRKSGVNLNVPNNNGSSLIEIACKNGNKNVVQYVLKNNVPTKIGDTGKTLLHLAASNAHAQVVLLIIQWNKDLIDEMDNSGNTALTTVISSFRRISEDQIVDTVRVLLEYGASVLIKSNLGKTALHYAAKYGSTKVIPLIIAANRAVLDEIDSEGRTALHFAIFSYIYDFTDQIVEIVRIFIDNGACVLIKDRVGQTPLHYAVKFKAAPVIPIIIAANRAVLDEIDSRGRSALHIAVCRYIPLYPIVQTVSILIDNGACVLIKDRIGQTALHYAAKYGATKVIPLLIAANREVLDKRDNQGRTALHIAIFSYAYKLTDQIVKIVRILIDNGASVLIKDNVGQTPLHYATKYVRSDIIPLIIRSNQAVVHEVDEMGNTALHVLAIYNVYNDYENTKVESTINILIRNGLSMHIENKSNLTPMDTIDYKFKHVLQKIELDIKKNNSKMKRSIFKRLLNK